VEKKLINFEKDGIKVELKKVLVDEQFVYSIEYSNENKIQKHGAFLYLAEAMEIANRLIEQMNMVH
jgi:hypothetical protein